ncbi:glycosyl hydrolase (plasmid) [Streptomyces sp. BHT-5-2]|uniref:glycosyl hydrolase family 18 protein n=1 Tax=Streptomyces sp. BHT-5-2 TaxID=2866715 RepID=UPI001C8DAB40|nr:glycosyl hydrolase family 18 protein [Streptomyces sp. BHT-5-2]QZL07196.1 glycosyl hydrolase [Streptomyces sp. BHT-5-2]
MERVRRPGRRWVRVRVRVRGRLGGLSLSVLLLVTGLTGLAAGAGPSAAGVSGPAGVSRPGERRPPMSAWLPFWGDVEGAYRDALAHAGQLRTVSPFWYETTSERAVDGRPGAVRADMVAGLHRAGIAVVPTVTETPDAAAMGELLHDPARRRAHVETLAELVARQGYDGIDLDYETMAVTGGAAAEARVRSGYVALVGELCARLHARGRTCVVTLMPRIRGAGAAFDYRRLGALADTVRFMGYDLHWSMGEPGPLSSKEWYAQILRDATAEVPRDRIELAFPGYGWDWVPGSGRRATHVTWHEAEALRKRVGARYTFDEVSGTPHFRYTRGGERHEVWYQDARGVRAQLAVPAAYGVRGRGLWALGFEDPGVWTVFRGEQPQRGLGG